MRATFDTTSVPIRSPRVGWIGAVGWALAFLAAAVLVAPGDAWAQETGSVGGTVIGEAEQPLQGVRVTIDGTRLGGLTDENGRYLIGGVPVGEQRLRVAMIGYGARERTVAVGAGGTATLDFDLQVQAVQLDEIVAVGYGTQRREEITSSVASITSDQFVRAPARDVASLVSGKLPGLAVVTPSGDPTEGTQISLRGVTSIQGSGNALVLIDGVEGDLRTVAPEDVESISVLKDGSAGAIYGSRASNGVILIETKKHTGGNPTIRYSGYTSYQDVYNQPDFLTADDYRNLRSSWVADSAAGIPEKQRRGAPLQVIANGNGEDAGYNTNWMDQVLRNPVSHRQNLTISGGTPTTNYTVSLDHENTEGIFLRSDNQQTTGRINVGHQMFDGRLRADVNLVTGLREYFRGVDYDYTWRQTLIRNPTDRVFNESGEWQNPEGYFYTNPLLLINETNGTHERRNLRLHGTLTFNPVDRLTLSLLTGTTRESRLEGTASTFQSVDGTGAEASRYTRSNVDDILQLTGTYSQNIGNHGFSLLGGYDYQDFWQEEFTAGNAEFPTDQFGWHQLGSGDAFADGRGEIDSGLSEYKVIGFFGRLNYDWSNRYLLTGSVRYEGNSRFGADHKWGLFPSVSAGWRLSEESFMSALPFVDDLKLRVGYGITGIAPDSSYLSLASVAYLANDQGVPTRYLHEGRWIQTLGPARNANPDLRWEEKDEINVGVDFALFDSRLYGSLDIYERNTRDMLFDYSVPSPPFPTGNILANVGHMKNSGIEAQLSYDVVNAPAFRWTTSANWSTNSNRLESLSDEVYETDDCFDAGHTGEPIQITTHRVCVGEAIGNFYGYESVDINDEGVWMVLNRDDEVVPYTEANSDDRRVLGNGLPSHYLAWNNSARLGNFDLNVNMRGAFGFEILNFQRLYYENPTVVTYNMLKSAFDPVYGKMVENENGELVPRTVNHPLALVSYYIEDGDYWKIDNATLGYTFRPESLGPLSGMLSSARLYVTGRNLLTITGYRGMDPEVPISVDNDDEDGPLAAGTDHRDQYPTTRTFSFGVDLTF